MLLNKQTRDTTVNFLWLVWGQPPNLNSSNISSNMVYSHWYVSLSSPHLSKSWKQGLASTLLWLALSLSRNITASSVSFSAGEAAEEKSTAPRRGMGPLRPEVVNTGEERGVQYVKPECRVKVGINLFIFRTFNLSFCRGF